MKNKSFLVCVFLMVYLITLCSSAVQAQHQSIQSLTITSEHLPSDRKIWVSLPTHYDAKQSKCHVLYLLDGDQKLMSNTIRTIRDELYGSGGYIQPLIIVGIEQQSRSKELSPTGKTGKLFFQYIEEEVIPLIEKKYRTLDDRIIAGHSLGGYYALNLWMKSSKFNSCLAFSPAIFNKDNEISAELSEYLATQHPKGVVYVNNGTESSVEQKIKKHIPELNKAFHSNQTDSLHYQYKEYEGYGHNFTPIVGITDGLLFHFNQWNIKDVTITGLWDKDLEPIATYEQYYSDLDGWAGFEVERNTDLLCNLSGHYLRSGDTPQALKLADYALEKDPNEWFAYLNKAQALLETDKAQAKDLLIQSLVLIKPTDFIESSDNNGAFSFWKGVIGDHLKGL